MLLLLDIKKNSPFLSILWSPLQTSDSGPFTFSFPFSIKYSHILRASPKHCTSSSSGSISAFVIHSCSRSFRTFLISTTFNSFSSFFAFTGPLFDFFLILPFLYILSQSHPFYLILFNSLFQLKIEDVNYIHRNPGSTHRKYKSLILIVFFVCLLLIGKRRTNFFISFFYLNDCFLLGMQDRF